MWKNSFVFFFRCAVHSQYCHFVIRSCLQFFLQFFFFFFFACAPTMHSDCNKNNWISISYTTFFLFQFSLFSPLRFPHTIYYDYIVYVLRSTNQPRCTPPNKGNDYQKIYSDWCHEFEKYKSAMKTWEKKQAVSNMFHMFFFLIILKFSLSLY